MNPTLSQLRTSYALAYVAHHLNPCAFTVRALARAGAAFLAVRS